MARIAVNDEALDVTNLDKVLFPASGFTKGEHLRYYEDISPVMLPHLARRPVTVIRYPNGIQGKFFFEKRCPAKRPDWVASTSVTSTRHGRIDYCTIDNPQTLVWMANRAAIEYHTALFRADHEDEPTMLVFDLDPGAPATLLQCLDIGVVLRDLLAQLGLKAFAKTSGGKGLHLGIPLRGARFAEVKAFAKSVADLLAREEPKRVTSVMTKAERTSRVFIDWSQNDHGKTTACAYTLRARERPLVSAPLSWDEIERARRRKKPDALLVDPEQMRRRVQEVGDLFAPVLSLRQRLPKLKTVAAS
ncbi:MAG TPA: non-homologous end-joining DNA ligase [Planctomycetota bacterium]|nr:non-homologous end-joining DNA ligase [Planctomycetota bacterium]